MDDPVLAVHELLRRLAVAETTVQIIAAEWVQLTHDEKMRMGEISPSLVDAVLKAQP